MNNVANVMSVGDSVNSYSDIFAAVEGEKMTSNVLQQVSSILLYIFIILNMFPFSWAKNKFKFQGRVAGQGATLSNVNGGSSMQNSNGALSKFTTQIKIINKMFRKWVFIWKCWRNRVY